ncbi:MAG: DUF421 domain-containing protein [Oculatellaceae cyanobacterium bins.114]|nr:DUF421 domain-containing protein [Oculatellaceae cyanobacterium bins.114]
MHFKPIIFGISDLFTVSWHQIFTPSVSLVELFIRGSLVYLILFSLLRFLPNRQVGAVGIADLLVIILFANAAQNAMASDYSSLTDGLILVATIVFWNYLLNWLGFKFPKIQRLLSPPPLMLVKNGRMIFRNMRRELITEGELMLQLRKQGVEKIDEVKMAFMEADGSVSVITHSTPIHPSSKPPALG